MLSINMFKKAIGLFGKMDAKTLSIMVGLTIMSHFLIQVAANGSLEAKKSSVSLTPTTDLVATGSEPMVVKLGSLAEKKGRSALVLGSKETLLIKAMGDKAGLVAKDLSTAEGHHHGKYMLVKKKPKHKKIKMEVFKPEVKYKKIKMKIPVKKMKKKKIKGYLVKKKHHH